MDPNQPAKKPFPPNSPAREGGVIGSYRVEGFLGSGAMGDVFLVRHTDLQKLFALKILKADLCTAEGFVPRFKQEARILANLEQRNIVNVSDSGEDRGRFYLVMEYVEGGTLREYLQTQPEKRLGQLEVVGLLKQVLQGLIYAHGREVLHRDLRLMNILRSSEGRVKITDFGLAKVAETWNLDDLPQSRGDDPVELSMAELEGPSMVSGRGASSESGGSEGRVGSWDYQAPEAREGVFSERSDIYSLGVLTYLLLTGTKPIGYFTPASKLVAGVHPAWDKLISKCLSNNPRYRFASAKELLERVEKIERKLKFRAFTWGRAAAAAVALLAGGFAANQMGLFEDYGVGPVPQSAGGTGADSGRGDHSQPDEPAATPTPEPGRLTVTSTPHATVRVIDASERIIAEDETDRSGELELEELPPGDYRVRIILSGYGLREESIQLGEAEVKAVEAPLEAIAATIALTTTPAAEVKVGNGLTGEEVYRGFADADGFIEIPIEQPKSYYVVIEKPGFIMGNLQGVRAAGDEIRVVIEKPLVATQRPPASLLVATTPNAWVELMSDGVPIPIRADGNGEALFTALEAGTYKVRIYGRGYREWVRPGLLELEMGEDIQIVEELEPLPLTIVARSEPGAEVLLRDGEGQSLARRTASSSGTAEFSGLAMGSYRLEATLEGHEPGTALLTAREPGEQYSVRLPLKELPGRFTLQTSPNATVVIYGVDDRVVDRGEADASGRYSKELQSGAYQVSVEKTGFRPSGRQRLVVSAGRTSELTEPLFAMLATLKVTSDPSGVDVYIAGERVGQTPLDLEEMEIPPDGFVEVTLRKPGYEKAIKWIRPSVDRENKVHFDKLEKLVLGGVSKPATPEAAPPQPADGSQGFARDYDVLDLQMTLVWIRPTLMPFDMGSPATEEGSDGDERPQMKVAITDGFWLGRHEVTQDQFRQVMRNNPSANSFGGGKLPVDNVTWTEATRFAEALTERERAAGRLPPGYVFALPTEAQWEYACRANSSDAYAFGGNVDLLDRHANFADSNSTKGRHLARYDDGYRRSAPVGAYQPNALGLYDMHGNVSEWVRDYYAAYPGGQEKNYAGPASGSTRVVRGGSYLSFPEDVRSANRNNYGEAMRHPDNGFRVALVKAASVDPRQDAESSSGSVSQGRLERIPTSPSPASGSVQDPSSGVQGRQSIPETKDDNDQAEGSWRLGPLQRVRDRFLGDESEKEGKAGNAAPVDSAKQATDARSPRAATPSPAVEKKPVSPSALTTRPAPLGSGVKQGTPRGSTQREGGSGGGGRGAPGTKVGTPR